MMAKPIAVGMAISVPMPDAVAMARWMVRLHQVITVIAIVPPPMPSSDENVPRPPASATNPTPLGMVSLTTIALSLGTRKFTDISATPMPKMNSIPWPLT